MRRGLLASRDELSGLRERIADRPFDAFYDRLHRRCSLILEAAPITENSWQSLSAQGHPGAAVNAARATQGRILDLLVAHHIEPDRAYHDRAIEELKNLISWSTWVDPSHGDLKADICTAEAAVAAVGGLDWLWEEFDSNQRDEAMGVLQKRVLEPYLQSIRDDVWWYTAVNHWNAVINSACGMVGLALSDEIDAAKKVYQLSRKGLQHFFDDLGREGGWDEGIGYWGYAISFVVLFGEACARLLDDQKLLHQRGMDETGLFPIYFSPNGRVASFGDSAKLPLHGALYLLDRYSGRKEITWWLDTYSFSHDVNTMDWSHAGLALLFRAEKDGVKTPPLKPVKVFKQIGWAAMADSWPHPSFYVAAKTGDLAISHAQKDMNSIQLQVDGEMLLTDPGHPPDEGSEYFSGARGQFYEVQAQAHNTITVAEEDHRPDAQGSIRNARSDGYFRWILCDAGAACGEGVRFFRHIVMLIDPADGHGRTLVVLDELDLPAPERVDLFWHTGGEIELDARKMTGQIVGHKTSLHFAVVSTAPAKAETAAHKLDYGRIDRYVRISAGGLGQCYFASVFSRDAIKTKVHLKPIEEGDVQLAFGGTTLRFKRSGKHLTLGQVTTK
ncbi:hypothetical protein LCGC14_0367580 [marine sediment metagenome]|uniref:Heparinase II/III-like C-terminal domain-containing protein n=1 Tax=marine sediment metagenome TaxID=412755 RepID=A0A0F9TNX7_9ZZZZ